MNKLALNDKPIQKYDRKTLRTKFFKLLAPVSPLYLPVMSFLPHLNYNLPGGIKYLECQIIYLSLLITHSNFPTLNFGRDTPFSLKSTISVLVISMHIMGFEDECWVCEQVSKNQTSKEQKSWSRNRWENN